MHGAWLSMVANLQNEHSFDLVLFYLVDYKHAGRGEFRVSNTGPMLPALLLVL